MLPYSVINMVTHIGCVKTIFHTCNKEVDDFFYDRGKKERKKKITFP